MIVPIEAEQNWENLNFWANERVYNAIFKAYNNPHTSSACKKEIEDWMVESPEFLDPYVCLNISRNVFSRGKLPTILHNRMLCYAIKDPNNKFVKKYLKFKKVCA